MRWVSQTREQAFTLFPPRQPVFTWLTQSKLSYYFDLILFKCPPQRNITWSVTCNAWLFGYGPFRNIVKGHNPSHNLLRFYEVTSLMLSLVLVLCPEPLKEKRKKKKKKELLLLMLLMAVICRYFPLISRYTAPLLSCVIVHEWL